MGRGSGASSVDSAAYTMVSLPRGVPRGKPRTRHRGRTAQNMTCELRRPCVQGGIRLFASGLACASPRALDAVRPMCALVDDLARGTVRSGLGHRLDGRRDAMRRGAGGHGRGCHLGRVRAAVGVWLGIAFRPFSTGIGDRPRRLGRGASRKGAESEEEGRERGPFVSQRGA